MQGFCYSTDAIPSRLKALKDKVLLVGTAATGLAGSGYLLVTHEARILTLRHVMCPITKATSVCSLLRCV